MAVIVTGNGSPTRPYLIDLGPRGNPLANLTVTDDPGGTLDLTISGAGTTTDKRDHLGPGDPVADPAEGRGGLAHRR